MNQPADDINRSTVVRATVPLHTPPNWAVLQRRLFDLLDDGWRAFSELYCEPDGQLIFDQAINSRDGADDFYEAFFNWPALYLLGGADDLLDAVKHHWRGVTTQLTEMGMVADEYEVGYDWFHQGESNLFFYGICAADPEDEEFRARAKRFADLYLPGGPNYDPELNTIGAPHNGSRGLRPGVGEEWANYSTRFTNMQQYGRPLHHLPGIAEWDDLADDGNAQAMGSAMQSRMGLGDVPMNLASTSLVTNAWLYDGEPKYAEWVQHYLQGWADRAHANGGIVPDNVAPDGVVGGLHDGRWYGGHYGWTWPHGLASVGMGTLVAGLNAYLITGDSRHLDLARDQLDAVMNEAVEEDPTSTPWSLRGSWMSRMGARSIKLTGAAEKPGTLVPYRYGENGWFDYGPMMMALPTWLWWSTMSADDQDRLKTVIAGNPGSRSEITEFRDKEEAGHELPWLSYLWGVNPDYPELALTMAIGQANRRLALMDTVTHDPKNDHIHFWQQVQPVVTEVLTQLTTGAPQVLYNGGLQGARVRYFDGLRRRPGLPKDIAALVDEVTADRVSLELVNLGGRQPAQVIVQAGAFGEHRIDEAEVEIVDGSDYPGGLIEFAAAAVRTTTSRVVVGDNRLTVDLPPRSRIRLTLQLTLRALPARHQSIS
ncbi:hypothetical protein [Agromyces ramosus]|uniref:Linalool dehydratase/isomerase domain-containing protein n=1 Tax=Agromyces ramosus TaxID=33879 RepID=A0ABU0RAP7_9MICO|nr:hypothetical protein [Agromyces ramosus]MDQ0895154.1 hypothetical protein [Agromyces ramosus]